jgi:hypothetical protein
MKTWSIFCVRIFKSEADLGGDFLVEFQHFFHLLLQLVPALAFLSERGLQAAQVIPLLRRC